MKISQKKKCEGCNAFNWATDSKCEIGFPIEYDYDSKFGMPFNYRPKQVCPKPRTYDQLCVCLKDGYTYQNFKRD